jgi:hypothetical protein
MVFNKTTLRVKAIILSCIEVLRDAIRELICQFVSKLVQKALGLIPRSSVISKVIIIFGTYVQVIFQDIGLLYSPSPLYDLPAVVINSLPSILYISYKFASRCLPLGICLLVVISFCCVSSGSLGRLDCKPSRVVCGGPPLCSHCHNRCLCSVLLLSWSWGKHVPLNWR